VSPNLIRRERPWGTSGFAAHYKQVWHVIEAEGAGCDTLYPAVTLRRLGGWPAGNANRADFDRLTLPAGRPAILRPQLMPDERLGPTLAGVFAGRPELWRDHIDQHVFFWVSEDRRDRFIAACVRSRGRGVAGPGSAPVVIAIETAALLAAHSAVTFFSRINSGSTIRGGARARRDEQTLRPVEDWRGERVVELAIRAPVPLEPVAGRAGGSSGASGGVSKYVNDADRLTCG